MATAALPPMATPATPPSPVTSTPGSGLPNSSPNDTAAWAICHSGPRSHPLALLAKFSLKSVVGARPPMHLLAEQNSLAVQASPSSQGLLSGIGVIVQALAASSQVPFTHSAPVGQGLGTPTQKPPWHVSLMVQNFP